MTTTTEPAINITNTSSHAYTVDVLILSATSCSLSIVGGIVILASCLLIPEIRNFTRKLVVCLTVADLITASAYLLSVVRYVNLYKAIEDVDEEVVLCTVQSFFTTFSSVVLSDVIHRCIHLRHSCDKNGSSMSSTIDGYFQLYQLDSTW